MAPTQSIALERTASKASHVEVTIEVTETSTYFPSAPTPTLCPRTSLPPPYTAPSDPHLPLTTLSFFTPPPAPAAPAVADEELPSYRATPRTYAERCFFWGMLCPLIWFLGALKIRYPERIVGPGKHAPTPEALVGEEDLELGLPSEATSGNRFMTVFLWQEEERVWALRCAWCLGGFLTLVAGFAVVLYSSFHH